ncbi:hypothetical protein DQ04_04621000, partial [Trypanosoma grayi]|uniref:hypothetical protein n=1 Tax=Trypanosoma grayi TaxID=71804 RepID=UPI0004F4133C
DRSGAHLSQPPEPVRSKADCYVEPGGSADKKKKTFSLQQVNIEVITLNNILPALPQEAKLKWDRMWNVMEEPTRTRKYLVARYQDPHYKMREKNERSGLRMNLKEAKQMAESGIMRFVYCADEKRDLTTGLVSSFFSPGREGNRMETSFYCMAGSAKMEIASSRNLYS